LAGMSIPAIASSTSQTFTLNTGDVLQMESFKRGFLGFPVDTDVGGTLIRADKPVQVITGDGCTNNPRGSPYCDHIEESVLPAETLGKHYLVAGVMGPQDKVVGQTVRFVGNVDGTTLTYNPPVMGAPTTLNAGQVVDIGPLADNFEVTGNHEFTV